MMLLWRVHDPLLATAVQSLKEGTRTAPGTNSLLFAMIVERQGVGDGRHTGESKLTSDKVDGAD